MNTITDAWETIRCRVFGHKPRWWHTLTVDDPSDSDVTWEISSPHMLTWEQWLSFYQSTDFPGVPSPDDLGEYFVCCRCHQRLDQNGEALK